MTYEDFDITNQAGQQVGAMQFQYRGNFPSAYTEFQNPFGPLKPFKVFGATNDATMGMMMTSLAAGRSYNLGGAAPLFAHIPPMAKGRSPDFSGLVCVPKKSHAEAMIAKLNPETMIVMEDCVLYTGDKDGHQVKGWKLLKVGYMEQPPGAGGVYYSMGQTVGGKQVEPRVVKTPKEASDIVKVGAEMQSGDYGAVWNFEFDLPDPEKQIKRKGFNLGFGEMDMDGSFNPPRGGFAVEMQEVMVTCEMVRYFQTPCNFTQKRQFCCKLPLYAEEVPQAATTPIGQYGGPNAPPQVIMTAGTTFDQVIAAKQNAWAVPAQPIIVGASAQG